MFTLEIETDNAAFQETSPNDEVARILDWVAKRLLHGVDSANIPDGNGNTIGRFDLSTE